MHRRVIIVEDHADSAEGLAELLNIWGYEPYIARDGERALELVEALTPGAVLADIDLPGIDGHQLARRIRQMPAGGSLLILALSGAGDEPDPNGTGFDHYLMKPVDVAALERLLQARMGR
jgi:CheY-like chemotaxis protein